MEAEQIEERYGNSLITYTGINFWPFDARVEEITIEDIAQSLSMQCRFNGHIKNFYSVAEHSVRVSNACSAENALWGLLHDASEAYLGDVPTPIKRLLPDYVKYEDALQKVIAKKFNLTEIEPAEVKQMDRVLLSTEMRDLRNNNRYQLANEFKPLTEKITPWPQHIAKNAFLNLFFSLTQPSCIR